MLPFSAESVITAPRWLPARNATGTDIAPFSLVRVTGDGTDGVYDIAQPNADGQAVWIAGYGGIVNGTIGGVTNDLPAIAYYDTADGTPAIGETWGAENGSWKLNKNKAGFRICGDPDTTNGWVRVERDYYLSYATLTNVTVAGTLSSGAAAKGSDTSISSNATWTSLSLEVTGLATGTYIFWAMVIGTGDMAAFDALHLDDRVKARLYDSTAAAAVANSEFDVVYLVNGPAYVNTDVTMNTICITARYTVPTASTTVRVEGYRTDPGGGTWGAASINQNSTLTYVKIA